MNAFTTWLSPSLLSPALMHALAWALLHFLWQGTALAAIAALAMALCRRSSTRYMLAVSALVAMLAAPLATILFLERSGAATPLQSAPLATIWQAAVDRAASSRLPLRGSPVLVSATPGNSSSDDLPLLVEAWLIGVALFSLRTAGGCLFLERARRKQSAALSPRVLAACQSLQRRLGLDRMIRYAECHWLQAPAVIGWFRPVVLLPVTTLTGLSEDQLEAVIAHELAHIKRLDPFVNVFQIAVETVLFYHPAVWWLNQRIRAEREHCCDEMAVSLCGNPVEYARALTLMEEWRSAPVLVMAANRGPLAERILRVLGVKSISAGMRGIGLTGSLLCLTAALVAGSALLGIAHPGLAMSARQAAFFHPLPQAAPKSAPAPVAKPSAPRSPNEAPSEAPAPSTASSYIDAMKAAGLTDLSVDMLVALKIQGVTPEYVRGIREQGLHPDASGLIAMKVQSVTPEYVRELRALGLDLDEEQVIAFKVQGVDASYIRGLKEVGIQSNPNELIALKVQGVTPEYVRDLRAAGLTVSADNVIAMKIQDVTPEYVRGLKEGGLQPSTNDVVALRVQGATPEYVREIRTLGFNPSVNQVIALRVQDVTADYIKVLQSAGLKPSIDDIIAAKVQDITPDFIDNVRKHGFQNLTIQKLIQMRRLGILDSHGEI
jgi:beta-lactamase regulating signal transducer with metallopeptidase domain